MKTPGNRASVYYVQHDWGEVVEALDAFLANAFGEEWGEGVEAWRQKLRAGVVTYDLIYSGDGGVGAVEQKLRKAGAENLKIETYRTSPGK